LNVVAARRGRVYREAQVEARFDRAAFYEVEAPVKEDDEVAAD
jgi:hypothetical protein